MPWANRHQCLIYDGAPSKQLHALAKAARQHLEQRYRCFYLNSEPMVAGMRSYLAAVGVDVEKELQAGSLVLSSEQNLLADGRFDANRLIDSLGMAVQSALKDGYVGLFATGDMTWEFGWRGDFSELLQYEWRLEELFQRCPQLSGICQYHADTLPREAVLTGARSHSAVFINETLSIIHPHRLRPENWSEAEMADPDFHAFVARLLPASYSGLVSASED